MSTTIEAIMRGGKIELLENIEVPEGTRVLVTVIESTEDYTSEEEDAEDIRDAMAALEDARINGTKSLDQVVKELGL